MWPNLLHTLHKKKVPILLANARLSERSKKRYQIISNLTKFMISKYAMVAAQGLLDGERFIEIGLDPKKLIISGNIKFDLQMPDDIDAQGQALRQTWRTSERPTFIAASTHEGEEEILLKAFDHIREKFPNALMVLVPRHPDRFERVGKLCSSLGYNYVCRSKRDIPTKSTAVILGDTMGELLLLYAACDIAFVGGSLVPIGGHNLIEPAALGLPVLTGPNLRNFTEISKILKNAGAAQIVDDPKSIASAVIALLSAQELCEKMGARGREVVATNRGALAKHLDWVEQNLSK